MIFLSQLVLVTDLFYYIDNNFNLVNRVFISKNVPIYS